MVTSIPRHDHSMADKASGIRSLDETATWLLEVIEESDIARAQVMESTLILAETRCAADAEATMFETWEAWVTAMQLGSALFAAAVADEGTTVVCRIKEKDWRLPATGPQSHLNAGTWVNSYYLALICRDKERLTQLARVPVSLLRASGAVFDEYIYSWVEALQRHWLREEGVSTKLVEAVDGTGPDAAQYADQEVMTHLLSPPIILFYRMLRGDHDQFNEALVDALRHHKLYWSADDERAVNSDSLVALGPLAIACFARERGIPIEVESEYLPKALLEFAWEGEIDM